MRSEAKTVPDYVAELSPERKALVEPLLALVRENLPAGYQEVMNWGMVTWEVPLSTYPQTYNKQPLMFAALASQKNYVSLHLMGITTDPKMRAFLDSSGKKLKMGKGCINFTSLDELPLKEIGEIIRTNPPEKFIARFESAYPRKDKK